jgi:membrane protein YqaA with SNARE-associated domain
MISFGLFGLFTICFLSATLLPFPSEAAVIYFMQHAAPFWVIVVASAGNSLGGSTNYFLGFYGKKLVGEKKHPRSERLVKRYGKWAALLSWLPFLGDPLMVVLGYYKTPFWQTMLLMTLGKTLRYVLLFWGINALF